MYALHDLGWTDSHTTEFEPHRTAGLPPSRPSARHRRGHVLLTGHGPHRAGLAGRLDHATRVADPFHVVRVGNRCLDQVRRRVQNETLGHRGRKADPL